MDQNRHGAYSAKGSDHLSTFGKRIRGDSDAYDGSDSKDGEADPKHEEGVKLHELLTKRVDQDLQLVITIVTALCAMEYDV